MCILLLAASAGCAIPASGTIDARAGSSQTIRVDSQVVVRLPATMTAQEWRLTKFDSLKLPITVRPRLEPIEGSDAQEWVARFVARRPGTAEIIFTRSAMAQGGEGFIGERRRYVFHIRK